MIGKCVTITPTFVKAAPEQTKLTFTAFQNWIKRPDGSWEESNEGTGSLAPPADTVMDEDSFIKIFDGADMSIASFPDPSSEALDALEKAGAIYDAITRVSIAADETTDFVKTHQLTLEVALLGNRLVRLGQSVVAEVGMANDDPQMMEYLIRFADDYREMLEKEIAETEAKLDALNPLDKPS